ncbi:MAG: hypothetical protein J0H82_04620 [Alphaproteobacteria bacterium]|jgi:hypothetical protein|nr:hypothetical protein [Alphaproteobacteria bacterium]
MTPFRAARESLGWTIAEAGKALELSWRYVKRLDEGEREPHKHTIEVMRLRLAAKRLAETWAASGLSGNPQQLRAIDAAIIALTQTSATNSPSDEHRPQPGRKDAA